MLDQKLYSDGIGKVYAVHQKELPTKEVLLIMYDEMKELSEYQFNEMIKNMLYANAVNLYNFLRALPNYQNEKNIREYVQKRNEKRVYGFKR